MINLPQLCWRSRTLGGQSHRNAPSTVADEIVLNTFSRTIAAAFLHVPLASAASDRPHFLPSCGTGGCRTKRRRRQLQPDRAHRAAATGLAPRMDHRNPTLRPRFELNLVRDTCMANWMIICHQTFTISLWCLQLMDVPTATIQCSRLRPLPNGGLGLTNPDTGAPLAL